MLMNQLMSWARYPHAPFGEAWDGGEGAAAALAPGGASFTLSASIRRPNSDGELATKWLKSLHPWPPMGIKDPPLGLYIL